MGKPKDFGHELKSCADTVTGIFLFLELQEGKEPMRVKRHASQISVKAGYTLHLGLQRRQQGVGRLHNLARDETTGERGVPKQSKG